MYHQRSEQAQAIFPSVEISTGGLCLAPVKAAELAQLAAMVTAEDFSGPESMLGGWHDPRDPVGSAAKLLELHQAPKANYFELRVPLGVYADSALIGAATLHVWSIDRRVGETSSFLAPSFRGQGYGQLLRRALLVAAFGSLGVMAVRSVARSDNAASLAITEKLGYHTTDRGQLLVAGTLSEVREDWLMAKDFFERGLDAGVAVSGLSDWAAAVGWGTQLG